VVEDDLELQMATPNGDVMLFQAMIAGLNAVDRAMAPVRCATCNDAHTVERVNGYDADGNPEVEIIPCPVCGEQ
jgi:hypothetical protein